MSSDRAGAGSVPEEHPDRLRWNAKYAGDFAPSGLRAEWCLGSGEPASLLPPDFTLIDQRDRGLRRQMLARRRA
jgi:hypothetical protein